MEKRRYMNVGSTILRYTGISYLDSRHMIWLIRPFDTFNYIFNTWTQACWKIFRHYRLYVVLTELFIVYKMLSLN